MPRHVSTHPARGSRVLLLAPLLGALLVVLAGCGADQAPSGPGDPAASSSAAGPAVDWATCPIWAATSTRATVGRPAGAVASFDPEQAAAKAPTSARSGTTKRERRRGTVGTRRRSRRVRSGKAG